MEKKTTRRWAKAFGAGVQRFAPALGLLVAMAGPASADCPIPAHEFEPDPGATTAFLPKWCTWRTKGSNPFFKLRPGYQIVLESDEEKLFITVLDETRWVDGVRTRVVEEAEYEKDDDELILVERSLNYVARCRETNSVFYFGEDVEFYDDDGNFIGSEGAWLAGRNGARPGIVMPGTVLNGARYYEEIAPEDSALDKGEVLSVEMGCEVNGHVFHGPCATIAGSNDCDDDEDEKVYVAGVGIVKDDDLEIVSYGYEDDDRDDED